MRRPNPPDAWKRGDPPEQKGPPGLWLWCDECNAWKRYESFVVGEDDCADCRSARLEQAEKA